MSKSSNQTPLSTDQLGMLTQWLETIARDRSLLANLSNEDRTNLVRLAGEIYCPDVRERRRLIKAMVKRRKDERVQQDQSLLNETGIRKLRRERVFTTPNYTPPALDSTVDVDDPDFREVVDPQNCYICKKDYSAIHFFYDQLCPECARLNYTKRTETTDLKGRVALLTGGRVKIGYQAGIKLLRAGARLIVTTRFPRDAAVRFSKEEDFADWKDRLQIHGLDLRHTPSVNAFCQHLLTSLDRLDFIINNACQTVRRPPAFYEHMMEQELGPLQQLPLEAQSLLGRYEGLRGYHLLPSLEGDASNQPMPTQEKITHAPLLSQIPLLSEDRISRPDLFPQNLLDQDLQQVDLRDRNSWRMLLAEVPTVELMEVHLVNAIAPFVLNARLKSLMERTPERDKHIVNVSAVEGQFYRRHKTTRHPHTNMAKAALNMMTRTSATDYHASGIHMNAVDTGWVTDEDPLHLARRKTEQHQFHPPLDIVDGAARIVDPIISGFLSGHHVWGQFLKDYQPTDW